MRLIKQFLSNKIIYIAVWKLAIFATLRKAVQETFRIFV